MSTNVLSFILDTLQPKVNDPTNEKLWAPNILKNLKDGNGAPVLPLQFDGPTSVQITGDDGNYIAEQFAEDYPIANNESENYIPCPDSPYPTLELHQVTINGLENVYVISTSTITQGTAGYDCTMTVQFGYYPQLGVLAVLPHYKMSQAICSTTDGKTCDGNAEPTVTGTGTVEADISNCFVDCDISVLVNGDGAGRQLQATMSSITLRGPDPGSSPTVQFKNLVVDSSKLGSGFNKLILRALNSTDGKQGIMNAVSAALSTPENLDTMSQVLSTYITQFFDTVFSPLPGGGLPADGSKQQANTAFDLYLFDRARVAVNNSGSQWYLPLLLASSGNPVLEPYTASEIDIPDQTIKGLKYTGITLTGVSITSLSNAQAVQGSTILASPTITCALQLGTLPEGPSKTISRDGDDVTCNIPPAPPMSINANFSFTQKGFQDVPVQGTVTITAGQVPFALSVVPSGANASELELTVTAMSVDLGGASISPEVHTTPDDDPTLDSIAEGLLKNKDVISQISQALNGQLADKTSDLSEEFTKLARATINQQLDA